MDLLNNPGKPFFGESRRIFIAGILVNVMYLMIAAGFGSKFFADFNPWLKIGMMAGIIVFAILSVLLYPSVKREKGS